MDHSGQTSMRTSRVTALIMLLICLAAVPAAFLLPYLYGGEFAGATLLLLILIPGVYLLGLEAVIVQHFNATGLPKTVPAFWIATVVFNLTLNLLFVPLHGAIAAAVICNLMSAVIFRFGSGY